MMKYSEFDDTVPGVKEAPLRPLKSWMSLLRTARAPYIASCPDRPWPTTRFLSKIPPAFVSSLTMCRARESWQKVSFSIRQRTIARAEITQN